MFEERKKAKEVEEYRMTTNRRLHLIYQSVRDRKMMESEKVRQLKKVILLTNLDLRITETGNEARGIELNQRKA